MNFPKIAIVYVSYHSEPYWDMVLTALKKITYPKEQLELVIVDAPHPEHGLSTGYIKEKILPLSGTVLPSITFLPQAVNLGFAGNYNIGIQWALDHGCDYIFLHNQDGFLGEDCLQKLADALNGDQTLAAVQPLVTLYPEQELINSAGNCFQYLGFGYCGSFLRPVSEVKLAPVSEIAYASGAALLLRADFVRAHGLLNTDLISYHEDLEFGLRARLAGYREALVSGARFYHQYSFSRNKNKFYLLERNRYAVMLECFHWRTLILFLPMAIVMEIGLLTLSIFQGWWRQKLSAWGYWCKIKSWKLWLAHRRRLQAMRRVSDREVLKIATPRLEFEGEGMNNFLIKIGNVILAFYWKIIYKFL